MDDTGIRFSRGSSIRDTHPRQLAVADFDSFVQRLDRDRAPSKDRAGYVCAPINGSGHRCAEGAEPRRWLPLDFDQLDAETLPFLREWLMRFSGVGWATHSSTPDAPRDRAIIELNRAVTRAEGIAIGRVLAKDIRDHVGVVADEAVSRGEQAVFLPPTGVPLARFVGEPLVVDDYLAAAKDLPTEPDTSEGAAKGPNGALEALKHGEGVHESIGRLIARWARCGLGRDELVAAARGALELARPVRGGRVDELAGAELDRLVDGALRKYGPKHAEPPADATSDGEPPLFSIVNMAELRQPAVPQGWVWNGYLPRGHVSFLTGHGGAGKTTLALLVAVCAATGIPALGRGTERVRVLFVSAEDPVALVLRRLRVICDRIGVPLDEVGEWLQVIDLTEGDPILYTEQRLDGVRHGVATPLCGEITDYVRNEGFGLVIVDNASDVYDGDEIHRAGVRGFVRALRAWAHDGAVLLLGHVDKSVSRNAKNSGTESYSGSTAWNNSVRSRLYLLEVEPGVLELQHQKNNVGPKLPPLRIEWRHDDVMRVQPEPGGFVAQLEARGAAKALLKLTHEYALRGEWVATSTSSRNNAVRLFSEEKNYPRAMRPAEIFATLRDAERDGLLVREGYRDANRKPHERWMVTPKGCDAIGVAPTAPSAPTSTIAHPEHGAQGARQARHPALGGCGGMERAQMDGAEGERHG